MKTITTKSGSQYLITEKDGKTYLMRGLTEYLVESISYKIGEPMRVMCRKLNSCTYEPSKELTQIISTPVVNIIE